MTHSVGIWIDHQRAVLVTVAHDQVTTTIVTSDVGAHPHFGGHQDGGGEKRYEERHTNALDRYYDDVITHLTGPPEALFLFGPGEAKGELHTRLGRSKVLAEVPVHVESADTLTDPQIVAHVTARFGPRR